MSHVLRGSIARLFGLCLLSTAMVALAATARAQCPPDYVLVGEDEENYYCELVETEAARPPRDVIEALEMASLALARQLERLTRDIDGALAAAPPPPVPRTVHEGVILGLENTPAKAVAFGLAQTSPFTGRPYRESIAEGKAQVVAFGDPSIAQEWFRGVLDNQTYAAYTLATPVSRETVRSLRGTHFNRLIAHSNGATTAEALIRSGVITVDELNIVGGDRSLVNDAGYRQLLRSGTVKRVKVWINPGDPIPFVSSSPLSWPIRNVALYLTERLKENRGGDAPVEIVVFDGPDYEGQRFGGAAHSLADAYFPNMAKATSR